MTLIDQHKAEILEACSTYKVKELHAFGSVLSDQFSDQSDVDFTVDFNRDNFNGSFQQFIGFKQTLETILKRTVDLVSIQSVRNPVFLQTLNKTKQCIYAA
ncbi:MAG TPA: nucleotidyltransferase domain-containing protein [Tichowtungia sp.]|nr:nucleotidyltransferase domain-containing protein [Tichowtungia sp.]